jgi:putative redox protein
MRVAARRIDGYAHAVDIEGGHSLVLDEPPEKGGTDTGPRPTQLLAAGLAACTAITVEMYAERKGWELGTVEVDVDFAYEKEVPVRFELALRVGAELSEEQRERLLVIASKCPVHRVLASEAQITIVERMESA